MSHAVWKFHLDRTDVQDVKMPAGTTVLSAQAQGASIVIWARVDPTAPLIVRRFRIIGTGHLFNAAWLRYVATVQDVGRYAGLVWHVFECSTDGVPMEEAAQ